MRQRTETEQVVEKIDTIQLNKESNNNAGENRDYYEKISTTFGTDYSFKRKIVWFNAIGFGILHIAMLYGFYLCFARAKLLTTIWMFILGITAGLSITMGAHRMWSHRSFKAKFIVQLVLIVLQTVSGQNCMWVWARDHRQHHRYADTDADPHNAKRGFFFSHIGWLMTKKHPLVIKMGKTIDMSDLEANKLIMLQKKYYKVLYVIFAIVIPVLIPVYFWGEDAVVSFFTSYIGRYMMQLHGTWSVNSVAHLYGTRPFDKDIMATESVMVSFIGNGEGWHNYHHVFPWDYKAAEYGKHFQNTTHLIDFLAKFGLVYDLKQATPKMVQDRLKRTGDGSYNRMLIS